jgi:hypothetical protein
MFQKLDLFLSSGQGREAPTLLSPLDRANQPQSLDNPCHIKRPYKHLTQGRVEEKVTCTEWNFDTNGSDHV